MHNNDTHLRFLKEKIEETKVALFRSEINSVLSLPPNVIQVLKTDNDGNIYFFTSCPGKYAAQINQPFYAYLDFHKKGTNTRMQVSGKAFIVHDEVKELNINDEDHSGKNAVVLIKMKIMQAEYFDRNTEKNMSLTQKLKSTFTHLFSSSSENYFHFGKNFYSIKRQKNHQQVLNQPQ